MSGEYIAGLEKRTESFSGKLEGAFDPPNLAVFPAEQFIRTYIKCGMLQVT
ncbi:MAG: hypothetical protein QXS15_06725 [Candidatus Jordarchaeales archaeon]